MFTIPTCLHPRKAHSREFKPPLLWPWSLSPAIEPSSSSHRHTRIIFRLSDGNRGWSWRRKAGGQEFTEGLTPRLGGCSVRVGSLQGCHSVQETRVGSQRRRLWRYFPPPLRLFPKLVPISALSRPPRATGAGSTLWKERSPDLRLSGRHPASGLLRLSLALRLCRPPFKF